MGLSESLDISTWALYISFYFLFFFFLFLFDLYHIYIYTLLWFFIYFWTVTVVDRMFVCECTGSLCETLWWWAFNINIYIYWRVDFESYFDTRDSACRERVTLSTLRCIYYYYYYFVDKHYTLYRAYLQFFFSMVVCRKYLTLLFCLTASRWLVKGPADLRRNVWYKCRYIYLSYIWCMFVVFPVVVILLLLLLLLLWYIVIICYIGCSCCCCCSCNCCSRCFLSHRFFFFLSFSFSLCVRLCDGLRFSNEPLLVSLVWTRCVSLPFVDDIDCRLTTNERQNVTDFSFTKARKRESWRGGSYRNDVDRLSRSRNLRRFTIGREEGPGEKRNIRDKELERAERCRKEPQKRSHR